MNGTEQIQDKVVLVTGASSGIGEAIARELAARGAKVMLGARREEKLNTLAAEITGAGGTAQAHRLDVTKPESVQAFVDAAVEAFGKVDVLVNNAGIMPLSMFESLKTDEWRKMVDVNISGVLHGIAAVLPLFKSQQSGHFVNLSSIAGHKLFESAGVYCATKYAVRALSEGLRMELPYVRVTNISPGAVQSELADTITDEEVKQGISPVLDIAIPADAIARSVAFAIAQPADVDVNEMIVRPTVQSL